jgi:ribonuclease HI
MRTRGEILIYTDGACSGNPGPGGWAAILCWNAHKKEISGYEPETTNNRMELRAVIEALKTLKKKTHPIRVITDSQYIQHAFTKGWIENWIRRGWRTSTKEPVKNQDLWEELVQLSSVLNIRWDWTKGHAEDDLNNRCDELARAEIEKRRK